MKLDKSAFLLYAVTDRMWLNGKTLESEVDKAIKGGSTFVQIREKDLSFEDFVAEAKKIKKVTDKHNIPYVINDNIEVALEVGADGVHVGQSDMDAAKVREIIGEDKILGVSVQTVDQAKKAEAEGADYLGVGAIFATGTKGDADEVSFKVLKDICNNTEIPVIAIGGISEKNMLSLKGSGVDGVAVVSAIFAKEDAEKAAKELLNIAKVIVSDEV